MQGGGAPAADADQAQFEADKRAVYKSDSEFEASSVVSAAPPPPKKATKKPSKRKTPATTKKSRDSTTPTPPLDFARSSAAAGAGGSKRKASPPPDFITTHSHRSKRPDLFNILRAEEASCSEPKHRGGGDVTSSFASRVSTGTSRRTLKTSGDYFVDLKVYKTLDYVSNAADVRYKKALVTVKLQCDESSSTWEALQGFLGRAWTLFEGSEPVHYSDKIHFKS